MAHIRIRLIHTPRPEHVVITAHLLTMKIHDTITFEGIDNFNRPVFKSINKNSKGKSHRYGLNYLLFSHNTTKEKVMKSFPDKIDNLIYFGTSFNCEPTGGEYTVKII